MTEDIPKEIIEKIKKEKKIMMKGMKQVSSSQKSRLTQLSTK